MKMEKKVTEASLVPSEQRNSTIAQLESKTLDLLVIGGGIVGSGCARDAAMRGLQIGLVEQNDFSFGTSSRSSHLLHGGLRYLAQGFLRLVHEASMEKRVIHRIAPHLADPLPFLFPTRPGWTWARWKMSIGVKLYDLLCGRRNLGRSSTLSRQAIFEKLPGMTQKNITGAVRYFDGLTNDARLVLDTLRSAQKAGAILANYVQYKNAQREGDVWIVEVEDVEAGRTFTIRTRQIINATGPWSDKLLGSHTKLRLTKGVHLVVDREQFPIPEAIVMTEGSRILFGIPWGERVILGTTDTDYDGPIESPDCNDQDIAYILDVVAILFPNANITKESLVSYWSGLRPLVADPNGNPSDISRRHEIKMGEPGWWDITGGKLTTYRLMSEQAIDQVVKFNHHDVKPCRTATEPLLNPAEVEGVSAVVPVEVSDTAVQHYCQNEWVRHLDDLMIRRTYWHYYYRNREEIARRIVNVMAESLGWDTATTEYELNTYLKSC